MRRSKTHTHSNNNNTTNNNNNNNNNIQQARGRTNLLGVFMSSFLAGQFQTQLLQCTLRLSELLHHCGAFLLGRAQLFGQLAIRLQAFSGCTVGGYFLREACAFLTKSLLEGRGTPRDGETEEKKESGRAVEKRMVAKRERRKGRKQSKTTTAFFE
jgi:hypothetical protein